MRTLPTHAYMGLEGKTKSVFEQIRTSKDPQEGLAELQVREEEARKKGIDIDKIYELFGVTNASQI